MRHRNRRRAHRRLAVDFGMVALVDLGIVATEPDSANWEAAIASALWDAGFLQQWQRAAACTDKDELGLHRPFLAAIEIVNLDAPAPVFLADEISDAVPVMYLAARLADEILDQMMGDGAVVDVS